MNLNIKKVAKHAWDALFFISGKDDNPTDAWKFRRRLIYGSYRVGVFVIVASLPIAIFLPVLQDLAIAAIQTMVGMLSIIVSAYVAGAVVDDKINKKNDLEP
jgi:hypothetical protein